MIGAHRASPQNFWRLAAIVILATVLAISGLATATPSPVSAGSGVKVVIVVGPVEGNTARYKEHGHHYADLARSMGATVTEVFSPYATWSKVKAAAQGANIFIYIGHGNGSPSPYGTFSPERRNGLGLNASYGNGNSNVKYYGQTPVRESLDLANDSVVLLNHLCYASGNSEPGRALPSKSVAMQRADGYGTGFLRTGAKAVFANGHGSLDSIISDLLTTDKTVGQMFHEDPAWSGSRHFRFHSQKTSWATVWMDPESKGRYYHSVNGKLTLTAAQVREG
jgi:hypothetical protein